MSRFYQFRLIYLAIPDYQLYLAVNDIEHTRTKARSPQTNGICERFHKTILQEFYQPALRRKVYNTLEEVEADLDEWLDYYNNERTHQGKKCCGRTPLEILIDGKSIWKEIFVNGIRPDRHLLKKRYLSDQV